MSLSLVKGVKMSKADENLIIQFSQSSTGATIHDDRNLTLKYIFNMQFHPEKGMEMERQILTMVANRKLAKIR